MLKYLVVFVQKIYRRFSNKSLHQTDVGVCRVSEDRGGGHGCHSHVTGRIRFGHILLWESRLHDVVEAGISHILRQLKHNMSGGSSQRSYNNHNNLNVRTHVRLNATSLLPEGSACVWIGIPQVYKKMFHILYLYLNDSKYIKKIYFIISLSLIW